MPYWSLPILVNASIERIEMSIVICLDCLIIPSLHSKFGEKKPDTSQNPVIMKKKYRKNEAKKITYGFTYIYRWKIWLTHNS